MVGFGHGLRLINIWTCPTNSLSDWIPKRLWSDCLLMKCIWSSTSELVQERQIMHQTINSQPKIQIHFLANAVNFQQILLNRILQIKLVVKKFQLGMIIEWTRTSSIIACFLRWRSSTEIFNRESLVKIFNEDISSILQYWRILSIDPSHMVPNSFGKSSSGRTKFASH